MKNRSFKSFGRSVCIIALVVAGCTSENSVGDEAQGDVRGALVAGPGKTVPATADVHLVWMVTSGSPDYSFIRGGGVAEGTHYGVTFPSTMPEEALNRGMGVGFLVATPTGTVVPSGALSRAQEDAVFGAALGASGSYAVIYRAASISTPFRDWILDFPVGFSCGRLVPHGAESEFDSYAPTPCSDVRIDIDDLDNLPLGDWT